MNVTHLPFPNNPMNWEQYQQMYQESITDPESFWGKMAETFLTWESPWQQVIGHSQADFAQGNVSWFTGAKLNVCYNCIDRHLAEKGEQTAFIMEADEPGNDTRISYNQLAVAVNKCANLLKQLGTKKGDRICIYMPMITEACIAMLACARIGAVHSVVFGGFSPEALKDRILDSDCTIVITADEAIRGGKRIPLKHNVDQALQHCPNIKHCVVVPYSGAHVDWVETRDINYQQYVQSMPDTCEPEWMDAEDPLFILYTSGSTGKPKGVLHTSAGYLLQAAMSFHYTFNYQAGDIYWCTADVGWITGHSYIVYGPLAMAATSVVFAGIPTYPDASRCWQIIDRHQVTHFYTAPTAIRALIAQGDDKVTCCSRDSLKVLGTVGEPINPEVWQWYANVVGNGRCPIVDTWWQTETGAHMITPLASATPTKPGSACFPFFGAQLAIMDADGNELSGEARGALVIKSSWPAQIRTVFGDHQRLIDTYFSTFKGYYFTGDGAYRDSDGYYWITGRMDDVLNVSGHRLGTAEIESALVRHPSIAEAAVVGYPHQIKGQAIYAFVTLKAGVTGDQALTQELKQYCVADIGGIAKPEVIQWAPGLPKTRSGKIMRRILRKVAENDLDHLGDTSTLADPDVVTHLIANRITDK